VSKQKLLNALTILGFATAMVGVLSNPLSAQIKTGASTNLDQIASNTFNSVKKELLDAAAAHKVTVQSERAVYVSDKNITLIHSPLQGIEKYRDADFAAGVPLMLVIIKATQTPRALNGSYVVKVQFPPGASSGKAIFIDSKGGIAAQRELIIKNGKQFPLSSSADSLRKPNFTQGDVVVTPAEIPNITSTHCAHPKNPDSSCYVDCSGWDPYHTLTFSMF
jgi:hypothetical protein